MNRPIPEFNVGELPVEIVRKIYQDYFNFESRYAEIMDIVGGRDSRSLNNTGLVSHFMAERVLDDATFVQYLKENDPTFRQVYTIHYVDNITSFKMMNKMESMCQSWLMYLYH